LVSLSAFPWQEDLLLVQLGPNLRLLLVVLLGSVQYVALLAALLAPLQALQLVMLSTKWLQLVTDLSYQRLQNMV
jgi:hypothetical protein